MEIIFLASGRPMLNGEAFTAHQDFGTDLYEGFIWGKKLFELYSWIWDIINNPILPADWFEQLLAARCLAKKR